MWPGAQVTRTGARVFDGDRLGVERKRVEQGYMADIEKSVNREMEENVRITAVRNGRQYFLCVLCTATRQNFFAAQRIALPTTESRMSALASRPPYSPLRRGGKSGEVVCSLGLRRI